MVKCFGRETGFKNIFVTLSKPEQLFRLNYVVWTELFTQTSDTDAIGDVII